MGNKKHPLERGEKAASNDTRVAQGLMFYQDLAVQVWKSVASVKLLLKMYDKLRKREKSCTVFYEVYPIETLLELLLRIDMKVLKNCET